MSKTTRLMIYSALTEAQALRRFESDAAEAEREGYVPVARSWDRTTLTVTYHRLGEPAAVGPAGVTPTRPGPDGIVPGLMRRLGLAPRP